MAGRFSSNRQGGVSEREMLEQRYNSSRVNLLLVFAFTAINLFLLISNGNSYFLFSAFIPYYIAGLGMLLCGKFPEDYYDGSFSNAEFLDDTVFYALLIVAAVLTLVYILAWLLSSKNRVGWLIFVLGYFLVDTLGMILIGGISVDSLIDILFHGWVIVSLAIGIYSHFKMKSLPLPTVSENAEGMEQ